MTDIDSIAAAYDAGVKEEYNRLASNPLFEAEFELITELMQRYIAPGSVVIDVGAGPGRYAEFLLKRNCKVGVVDVSRKSLEAFNKRIKGVFKRNILFSEIACATNLSFIDSNTADAVLLMGPLYHLIYFGERAKAISEAFRILKKGGILFAVFLSTYNHIAQFYEENRFCCSNDADILMKDVATTVKFQGYNVPQYKCLPEIAVHSIEPQGFNTMHIRNLEGIGVKYTENEMIKYFSPEGKRKLLLNLRSTCENPELIGYANQFLYVGKKSFN